MQLPNLELLEYKAKQYFFSNKENIRRYEEISKDSCFLGKLIMEAYVFPQVWGSTCTGFDVDEEGNAMWGGDAMTEAYTTVFHEKLTGTYIVFFDGRVCYQVNDANEKFLGDLMNHRLERLSRAKKLY